MTCTTYTRATQSQMMDKNYCIRGPIILYMYQWHAHQVTPLYPLIICIYSKSDLILMKINFFYSESV